jgi:hypothetical protein
MRSFFRSRAKALIEVGGVALWLWSMMQLFVAFITFHRQDKISGKASDYFQKANVKSIQCHEPKTRTKLRQSIARRGKKPQEKLLASLPRCLRRRRSQKPLEKSLRFRVELSWTRRHFSGAVDTPEQGESWQASTI